MPSLSHTMQTAFTNALVGLASKLGTSIINKVESYQGQKSDLHTDCIILSFSCLTGIYIVSAFPAIGLAGCSLLFRETYQLYQKLSSEYPQAVMTFRSKLYLYGNGVLFGAVLVSTPFTPALSSLLMLSILVGYQLSLRYTYEGCLKGEIVRKRLEIERLEGGKASLRLDLSARERELHAIRQGRDGLFERLESSRRSIEDLEEQLSRWEITDSSIEVLTSRSQELSAQISRVEEKQLPHGQIIEEFALSRRDRGEKPAIQVVDEYIEKKQRYVDGNKDKVHAQEVAHRVSAGKYDLAKTIFYDAPVLVVKPFIGVFGGALTVASLGLAPATGGISLAVGSGMAGGAALGSYWGVTTQQKREEARKAALEEEVSEIRSKYRTSLNAREKGLRRSMLKWRQYKEELGILRLELEGIKLTISREEAIVNSQEIESSIAESDVCIADKSAQISQITSRITQSSTAIEASRVGLIALESRNAESFVSLFLQRCTSFVEQVGRSVSQGYVMHI